MEPMDLDHYSTYRQVNEASPPQSPYREHDVSDMDVDTPSPEIQMYQASELWTTSMGQVNHAVSSIMALSTGENNVMSHDHVLKKQMSCEGLLTPQNSGNLPIQRSLSWDLNPAQAESKKEKRRYRLPDDSAFSHFPEYSNDAENSLRQRLKQASDLPETPVMSSHSNRFEGEKFKNDKKNQNCYSTKSAKTSVCSCKRFLVTLIILTGTVISCLVYLGWQRRRCQLSRRFDHSALVVELESKIFGQHIATKMISRELLHYFEQLTTMNKYKEEDDSHDKTICKPLVLAFFGMTGVGKTFTSRILSEHFKESSIPVPFLNIPHVFPHKVYDEIYSEQVKQWILGNVTSCEINLFVLDELDKASAGVIEGIKESVDILTKPCNIADPVIILLLSNSNSKWINQRYIQLKPEVLREQTDFEDYKDILTSDTNQWYSNLKPGQMVDAFVPFLPMESLQVRQCVKRDLTAKGLPSDTETIDKVLKELTFITGGTRKISSFGCKRVPDKVDYVMMPTN